MREDEDERKEQTERLQKAAVVRAWTEDGFNVKKDPTIRALAGVDQQKREKKQVQLWRFLIHQPSL